MLATLRRVRGMFAEGRLGVLLFCWLGWVFDFHDLMLFQFVQRDVARDLGLELATDIPWIDGWTLLATAVGGFWFGRIADRVGRRRALTGSILMYSGGAFLTGLADGYASLLVARVVTGIGVGGEWGVGHAVVAETFPPAMRNRAAAILQAGTPVAMALAAVVGCFVAPQVGWRACFLGSAAPALLVFFARRALPGVDRAPGRDGAPWRELWSEAHRRAAVTIFALLVLHMTGFWCTYAWLPRMMFADLAATPAFVGTFFLCVNGVHVVADIAFGPLADRFGRRRVFAASCVLFAAGLLVVALTWQTLAQDRVAFVAALALVGLGAGTWSCFGVLFAENFAASVRGTAAAGFYNLARGVQGATQPLLAAAIATTGTFTTALHVGVVTALMSAVVIRWVPRVERDR